ncbi:FAD-binding protein [Hansschlegelia beijingensis]
MGTGPAGITLALELARKGKTVVLLEGGGPTTRWRATGCRSGRRVRSRA